MSGSDRHAYPGPEDTTRVELANGLVIISRANFNSPSVMLHGYLMSGSLSDPDDQLGLADFTAAALMRGTERLAFQEIYSALESVGASLGFGSATHTTSFSGAALVEDLDLLLDLLAQTLTQPIFPLEQVERLRSQFLTGLAIRAQDTARMASMAFDELIYAGHPYSRPEDGYPETIQAISRADLEAHHQRWYGPRNTVITLVGAIEPAAAVEKISSVLGNWHNPMQPEPPQLPSLSSLTRQETRRVTIPGKFQADLILGAAGPTRRSPDYLAASLANNILGQFGMMGRIGEAVREKAGLAYYADSSLGGGIGPGPWYISAGLDPGNIERAIELILAEIQRFVTQPVTPEELADSQAHYIGRLPLSLESNMGVASALVSLERYNLGLDYYRHYPDLVMAIRQEDIQAAAARYLDQARLGIAIAGP